MNASTALIAVVDDDAAVRTGLRRLMCAAGYRVQAFADGASFLMFLRDQTPDCVLLDLHMIGMDGLTLHGHLEALSFRAPVIVLTGSDSDSMRETAMASGVTAYLRKVVDGDVLLDTIARCLGSGRASPVSPDRRVYSLPGASRA